MAALVGRDSVFNQLPLCTNRIDVSIIVKLKNAISRKDQQAIGDCIQECYQYLTADGSTVDLIKRYFELITLFQSNGLSSRIDNLHWALQKIYPIHKEFDQVLKEYLSNSPTKELQASFLFEFATYTNDRQILKTVIDAVNHAGIFVSRETWSLYFEILEQACTDVDVGLITSAYELFIRKGNTPVEREFNLDYCFSKYRDDPRFPAKMGNFLKGANFSKHSNLMLNCLGELYFRFICPPPGKQYRAPRGPKVYGDIYAAAGHNLKDIDKTMARSLTELILRPKQPISPQMLYLYTIPPIVSFLANWPEFPHETFFQDLFKKALESFTYEEKVMFYFALMNAALHMQDKKAIDYILSLFHSFGLHQDPVCRKMYVGMLCRLVNKVNPMFIDCACSTFHRMSKIEGNFHTLQSYIDEFLQNLLQDSYSNVFDLLWLGLNVFKNPYIINAALASISEKKIHSWLPLQMDFSSMTKVFQREFLYDQEVWLMGSFQHNPHLLNTKIFKLPAAIIEARAPGILRLEPVNTINDVPVFSIPVKQSVLDEALNFMLNPVPLVEKSIEELADLFKAGDIFGMKALKKACLLQLENKRPELVDFPFLVNILSQASVQEREQLRDYLIFHIFRFLPQLEAAIQKIIHDIREIDKDCFKKIDLYSIFSKKDMPPGLGVKGQHPHVDLRDIKLLSRLFPEMIALDLKEAVLHDKVLKEIAGGLKNLERLSLDCSCRAVVTDSTSLRFIPKLREVVLYNPDSSFLKVLNVIPLTSIELIDLVKPDETFAELFKEKSETVQWLNSIRQFALHRRQKTAMAWFTDTDAACLMSRLGNVNSLTLENTSITNKTLKLIVENLRHLLDFKFAGVIHVNKMLTFEGIKTFLNQCLLRSISINQTREAEYSLANCLYEVDIQNLSLQGNITDRMVGQIADEHEDLTVLDISDNPLTDKCLIYLPLLKKLSELNLAKTQISCEAALNFALNSSSLRSLTLSPPGTAEERRKIIPKLYSLASKGVAVHFIR